MDENTNKEQHAENINRMLDGMPKPVPTDIDELLEYAGRFISLEKPLVVAMGGLNQKEPGKVLMISMRIILALMHELSEHSKTKSVDNLISDIMTNGQSSEGQ